MNYWVGVARQVAAKAGYEIDDKLAQAFGAALFEARTQGYTDGLRDYPNMPGHEAEYARINASKDRVHTRR